MKHTKTRPQPKTKAKAGTNSQPQKPVPALHVRAKNPADSLENIDKQNTAEKPAQAAVKPLSSAKVSESQPQRPAQESDAVELVSFEHDKRKPVTLANSVALQNVDPERYDVDPSVYQESDPYLAAQEGPRQRFLLNTHAPSELDGREAMPLRTQNARPVQEGAARYMEVTGRPGEPAEFAGNAQAEFRGRNQLAPQMRVNDPKQVQPVQGQPVGQMAQAALAYQGSFESAPMTSDKLQQPELQQVAQQEAIAHYKEVEAEEQEIILPADPADQENQPKQQPAWDSMQAAEEDEEAAEDDEDDESEDAELDEEDFDDETEAEAADDYEEDIEYDDSQSRELTEDPEEYDKGAHEDQLDQEEQSTELNALEKWEQKKQELRDLYAEQIRQRTQEVQKDPHEIVRNIMQKMINSEADPNQQVAYESDGSRQDPAAALRSLKISDVMSKRVVCVLDTTTLEELAGLFNQRKISAVPILYSRTRRFVGLITMADIFSQAFSQKLYSSLSVEQQTSGIDWQALMRKPVREFINPLDSAEVSPDCSLEEACDLMLKNQLHHLVITENNQIKGIFSSFDALRLFEARQLESQDPSQAGDVSQV